MAAGACRRHTTSPPSQLRFFEIDRDAAFACGARGASDSGTYIEILVPTGLWPESTVIVEARGNEESGTPDVLVVEYEIEGTTRAIGARCSTRPLAATLEIRRQAAIRGVLRVLTPHKLTVGVAEQSGRMLARVTLGSLPADTTVRGSK
jgi:hypothetical protein